MDEIHICPCCGEAIDEIGKDQLKVLREKGMEAYKIRQEYLEPVTWKEVYQLEILIAVGLVLLLISILLINIIPKAPAWYTVGVPMCLFGLIANNTKRSRDKQIKMREKRFEEEQPTLAHDLKMWEHHQLMTSVYF